MYASTLAEGSLLNQGVFDLGDPIAGLSLISFFAGASNFIANARDDALRHTAIVARDVSTVHQWRADAYHGYDGDDGLLSDFGTYIEAWRYRVDAECGGLSVTYLLLSSF